MRPLWMLSKMGRTNHMRANLPLVVRTTCVLSRHYQRHAILLCVACDLGHRELHAPLWVLSKMGSTNHMRANLPSVVRTTCVLISTLPAALFSTYTRAFSRTNHMRANLHTTSAFSTVIVVKVVVVIYIVIVISTDASAYFPLLDVIQISAVISGCYPILPGPSICALLDIYSRLQSYEPHAC